MIDMLDFDKSRLQSTPEPLVRELEAAGAKFRGRACTCPFHDDKHASAGIFQKAGGIWRFRCQVCEAGGDIFDIMARVQNKTVGEVLKGLDGGGSSYRPTHRPSPKPSAPPPPEDDCPAPDMPASPPPRSFISLAAAKSELRNLVATYVYTSPQTGKPEMYVFRIQPPGEHKRFLQGCPGPDDDSIILQAPEKPWPIYNRSRVARAEHVLVAEGEKAVHALTDVLTAGGIDGIAATTNPGGAGKSEHADWLPLAGKHVYLWPDNDPANDKGVRVGIDHMRQVQAILEALDPAPLLYWIDQDALSLPPKGDAFEFCERYPTQAAKLEALQSVMANADPLGASASVRVLLEDVIAGRVQTVPMPWKSVSEMTRALEPGTVTLLCGDGGAAKSLALLQAVGHWHFDLGHKVALFALEDDRKYHVTRALVQRTGEMGLADKEWIHANPDIARQIHRDNAEFMDLFGRLVYEAPTEAVPIMKLAFWVDQRAAEGNRIICIDPITAAQVGAQSWLDDQAFLLAVKKSVVTHGCSLVIVTHPKKGGNYGAGMGMDNLAGGACWSRFSQTILWLKNPTKKEREIKIMSACGPMGVECNRVMSLLKTRNGVGAGSNIAMRLERFKLLELGVIAKEKS